MKRILIIATHEQAFANEMLRGIGNYASLHGPWDFTRTAMRQGDAMHLLSAWEGDGVILPVIRQATLDTLNELQMPYVNVTAFPDVVTVRNDNAAIGRMGAQHLLARGFRDFGYLGVPRAIYSRQRHEAFEQTIGEAGFRVSYGERTERFDHGWSYDAEYEALFDWLADLPRPVGVMTANDFTAELLIGAAQKTAWRLPDDMAILGVDNEVTDDLLNPTLSSIMPDGRTVGFLAAETLDHLMRGESIARPTTLVPPLGLTSRRSTDTLGFDDEQVGRALRFIRRHPDRALNVEDVVAEVAMSRRTLERRFAAAVGHSPWREIRRVQIEHLKRMLIETDWPIKRIVPRSAFPSAARLVAVFREETGETPTAFRARHRLR